MPVHLPADWDRFRVEPITARTFVKRNLIHWELLAAVLRRSAGGVLEIGVGSGAQSGFLSRWVSPVASVDNDQRILGVARVNHERFGRGASLVRANAFSLPFAASSWGVAVSQGLMEHFSDEEVVELVAEQLRVCRAVVFSVPSNNYPRQDVGNERLMSPEEWRAILRRAVGRGYRVRTRYYRGDGEAVKYSMIARRWLGSFSVLATVDPLDSRLSAT